MELEFKAHWVIRRWNMDFEATGVKRKMQLSELDKSQLQDIQGENQKIA
jgi:hypothetical protein